MVGKVVVMLRFNPFDFYRFLLTVVVVVYSGVRLALFVWRCHDACSSVPRHGGVIWRYSSVLLLRIRMSRFVSDLMAIVVLACVAAWLIWLH